MGPSYISWFEIVGAFFAVAVVLLGTFWMLFRRNVVEQTSMPAKWTGMSPDQEGTGTDNQEETEEDEEGVREPVVGHIYPFEGTFTAKMRVDEVDEDESLIYGTLLIELDPGLEIKAVQKGVDEDHAESYICVTYVEAGIWKTLTWLWKDAEWPDFGPYELNFGEVEVTVAS